MIQNPTPENVEEYQELRKITSKKIRRIKREYKKNIRSIKEYRMNSRLFFRKCRFFKERFKAKCCIIKDANGCLITEESNIVEQFRSHFEKLLITIDEDGSLEED